MGSDVDPTASRFMGIGVLLLGRPALPCPALPTIRRYMILCYNQSVPERPSSATPVPGDQLTVDRLAYLSGTTTRNVRAFQTLGLLPRPTLHGRTGLYGPEHLDRLRAILRLQRSGFSLGAIGTLFAAWERGLTLEQVLGLRGSTVPG